MVQKRTLKQIMILTIVLGLSSTIQAGILQKIPLINKLFPDSKVHSLIITGNYEKPRLLAELSQRKNHQPIILISPNASGQEEFYVLMGNKTLNAHKMNAEECIKFVVEILQPEKIIFLGDNKIVPQKYKELFQSIAPSVSITGNNWRQNCKALSEVVKNKKLSKAYNKLLTLLEQNEERLKLLQKSKKITRGTIPSSNTSKTTVPPIVSNTEMNPK